MEADKRGIGTTKISFINQMVSAVVLTVPQHRPLCFANLGDTEEPMGIFVVPDNKFGALRGVLRGSLQVGMMAARGHI